MSRAAAYFLCSQRGCYARGRMRQLCLLLSCLVLGPWACAPKRQVVHSIPTEPLPAEAAALRRPEDSPYAARVRLDLTQRSAALRECLAQAPGHEALAGSVYTRALYVSPGIAYFPQRSSEPSLNALEQCVLELLHTWSLPVPVQDYEGVWVLLRLERGTQPASASHRASPLFELGELRASLELTRRSPYERGSPYGMDVYAEAGGRPGPIPEEDENYETKPRAEAQPGTAMDDPDGMVRPKLLEGHPIRYTQLALAYRVEGIMKVRCLISREGRLEACRILRPLPFMEMEVLQALVQNRYTPVTFRGEPVPVNYTFTIQLALPRR